MSMTLQTWVASNGGVNATARLLKISPSRISMWLAKKASPKLILMQKMVRMSQGHLTYEAIITSTKRGRR